MIQKSKIVIISAVFPPEPVVSAKLSFDIVIKLSERNTVTVISPRPSRPFGFQFISESLRFNFQHIQVDSYICASSSVVGRFRESYSFGKHCYRYIAEIHNNIDVIYANTWPLFGQYFAVKAARKYNIPIVLHVQDIYPESLSKKLPLAASFIDGILLPLDKYILGNASRVIAISQKMKDYLVKSRNLDDDKIAVVTNWQDEELFLPFNTQNISAKKDNNTFTFIYLGNIGPVAGIDLLIEAFNQTKLENSRLVIAGSGSKKEALEIKVKEKNYSNIEFWLVPEGKVPVIQSCADIMILSIKRGSAFSSVPSKLPAYMFSAKPIIACVDEDSDTANAIELANCGWVVSPDDVDKLADLMVKVRSIPTEKLQILGRNGYTYALANYSKKKNLEKLLSIIYEEYEI